MGEHDQMRCWASDFDIRPGTIYLNHGSFGIAPRPVRAVERAHAEQLASEPHDYFVRRYLHVWTESRDALAQWLRAPRDTITLVDNATAAMNVVAHSFPLISGDEVLLTDHAYGAVVRIWERACRRAGTAPPVVAAIPWPLHEPEEIVEALLERVTDRTRLAVISHITSPTALILPVRRIVEAMHERGVAVCVDGPHALGQVDVDLEKIGADFYTASCHKWLAAPLGTGFLYAMPKWHDVLQPPSLSWGVLPPDAPRRWWEEFVWQGTRNVAAIAAIPAAIAYLRDQVGLANFRAQTHALAQEARRRILERWCTLAWTDDDPAWYGSMVSVPLPPGETGPLQQRLWERHGIEVPIVGFQGMRTIRVSCHLYNHSEQIDRLVEALAEELPSL